MSRAEQSRASRGGCLHSESGRSRETVKDMVVGANQSGKGAKGLSLGKAQEGDKKDKKKPVSRSSRAGLQV